MPSCCYFIMTVQINKKIISFSEIPALAEESDKLVLMVRHSYRQSLQAGSLDPGLTEEGSAYARECGALLKGLHDTCYGSSARKRTVETVQNLMIGGGLEAGEIAIYPEIYDCSLFVAPEVLEEIIADHTISGLLKSYFTTGKAPRMIDLAEYSSRLVDFLTGTVFPAKNVILATHDVVVASLLLPLNVYPFSLTDWCGYIHGALLYCKNGIWTVAYAVPNAADRRKTALFI